MNNDSDCTTNDADREHATLPTLHDVGLPALMRLLNVARGHSGQCRRVACFLLGLYNGTRFPFDLTNLRSLDDELFVDCMAVLQMDARACQREVHTYFKGGSRLWEKLASDWNVTDVELLQRRVEGEEKTIGYEIKSC